MLLLDTPAEVYKLLTYFDLQEIRHLLCFICNNHKTLIISQIIIAKLCLSKKFQINSFMIFSKDIFCCRKPNIPPFQKL